MATIKLGELLVKANVLQEGQLKAALTEQQKWGGKLGEILVRMSLITEDVLVRALSKQMAIPAVNLDAIQGIPPHVKAKVPLDTARDLSALPLQLRDDGKTLVVAMTEPQNIKHVDTLRSITRCRIVPQLAGRTSIARAFGRFYDNAGELNDAESSFKVVDAQGNTVVKAAADIKPKAERQAPKAPPARAPALAEAPSNGAGRGGGSASEVLRGVEDVQRKEVAALKAMVELLIEKGIFTRDEYLAKVKR